METDGNVKNRSSDGMRCYLFGILFPIIYLSSAHYKTDRFIRFHAYQSIGFTTAFVALIIALKLNDDGRIETVLSVAWVLLFVLWIILMFEAFRGRKFKLPMIGKLAERLAG